MIAMSPSMAAKRSLISLSSAAHSSLCCLSSKLLVGMSTWHLLTLDWESKINVREFAAMQFDAAICPRQASIAPHYFAWYSVHFEISASYLLMDSKIMSFKSLRAPSRPA